MAGLVVHASKISGKYEAVSDNDVCRPILIGQHTHSNFVAIRRVHFGSLGSINCLTLRPNIFWCEKCYFSRIPTCLTQVPTSVYAYSQFTIAIFVTLFAQAFHNLPSCARSTTTRPQWSFEIRDATCRKIECFISWQKELGSISWYKLTLGCWTKLYLYLPFHFLTTVVCFAWTSFLSWSQFEVISLSTNL